MHTYYPTAQNPEGKANGHVLNVYTEPSHRQQGLAYRLVAEAVASCRARGIPRVTLHASDFGRSVYERLGFVAGNEMRLTL